MKKLIYLLLIFIFNIGTLCSQWMQQQSSVTNTLYGVSFLDAYTGLAVGEQAKIILTGDGGVFWESKLGGLGYYLKAVKFVNPDVAYAVGSLGNIVKSTDGGNVWSLQYTGIFDKTFNCVDFIDIYYGLCAGDNGTVMKTTDGGEHWNQMLQITTTMLGMHFFDLNTGIMCGTGGVIWKTTNGGVNWTSRYSGYGNDLYAVDFYDDYTGVIVGTQGLILLSTNTGNTWTMRPSGATNVTLFGVSCASANRMTAVGGGATVVTSTDGGQTWGFQATNYTNLYLRSIDFVNDNFGCTVGQAGLLYNTQNGGGVNILNISSKIPEKYLLRQNYPNPFNPSTSIEFDIKKSNNIKIDIFNTAGILIETILNRKLSAGSYKINWDSKNLSSGIYFYRLTTDEFSETKRMTLIK
jgi:photosystem II stability/assembly factor-like uncharacterized protein